MFKIYSVIPHGSQDKLTLLGEYNYYPDAVGFFTALLSIPAAVGTKKYQLHRIAPDADFILMKASVSLDSEDIAAIKPDEPRPPKYPPMKCGCSPVYPCDWHPDCPGNLFWKDDGSEGF